MIKYITGTILVVGIGTAACKTTDEQSQTASRSRTVNDAGFVKESSFTVAQVEAAANTVFGKDFTVDMQDTVPSTLITKSETSYPRWEIALIPKSDPDVAIDCRFSEKEDQTSGKGTGRVTAAFEASVGATGACRFMKRGATDDEWSHYLSNVPESVTQRFTKIIKNGVIYFPVHN